MISNENPLYMVSGVFNAVCVRGNMLGDSMFYGRGAGKLPTASAVVGDVVDLARRKNETIPCLWEDEEAELSDIGQTERSFYVRVKPEALEDLKAALPGGEVICAGRSEDCAYVTKAVREKEFAEVCEKLGDSVLGRIRMGE